MAKLIISLAALAAIAAANVFGATLQIDGSTTVGPIVKALAEDFRKNNPGVEITVSEPGNGNGAKSLVNGACDIAMLSRPLFVYTYLTKRGRSIIEDIGFVPVTAY